jgi:hypothetical protein
MDRWDVILALYFPIMILDIFIRPKKWEEFYADDPLGNL